MSIEMRPLAETLEAAICKALKERVEEIKVQVINSAIADVEKKVTKAVADVALSVASFYNIERMGANLLITVRIEQ